MSTTVTASDNEHRNERRAEGRRLAHTVGAVAVVVGYLVSAVAANWVSVHLPPLVLGGVFGGSSSRRGRCSPGCA